MGSISSYPHGFNQGVAIRGMPVLNAYSKNVLWVDSGGARNGKGTYKEPYATIDAAINAASANDVIMVKAGHAETITAAAGIDADVAGIAIVGLGQGNKRPTITFTTAAGADVDIDAADITIANMRFVCGINSQTAMIDVNSTGFRLEGCEFSESSATGLTCVDINGGASNACDKAEIIGNTFLCTTAANWDRAIELGEVANAVVIRNNTIIGDFDDAGVHNPTGKVLTNLVIEGNYVRNNQAGQHAIELVSACTGMSRDNTVVTDALATAYDAGALSCDGSDKFQDTTGGDSSGVAVFATADQTTNFIGTDDSNNAAATTNVTANRDGSILERLEHIANNLLAETPATFVPGLGYKVTKTSVMTGTADDIFDVTGQVAFTLITGEVTTVLATATTVKLNVKTDNVDLCAATTITNDADGTMYMLSGDTGAVLNGADAPALRVAQTSGAALAPIIVGNAGGSCVIEQTTDQAGTGAILWTAWYLPLEASATVAASA